MEKEVGATGRGIDQRDFHSQPVHEGGEKRNLQTETDN